MEVASHVGTVDAIVEREHRARSEDCTCADAEDPRDRQFLALYIHTMSEGLQRPNLRAEAIAELMAHLEEGCALHLRNDIVLQKEAGLLEGDGCAWQRNRGTVHRIKLDRVTEPLQEMRNPII